MVENSNKTNQAKRFLKIKLLSMKDKSYLKLINKRQFLTGCRKLERKN